MGLAHFLTHAQDSKPTHPEQGMAPVNIQRRPMANVHSQLTLNSFHENVNTCTCKYLQCHQDTFPFTSHSLSRTRTHTNTHTHKQTFQGPSSLLLPSITSSGRPPTPVILNKRRRCQKNSFAWKKERFLL